MTDGEADAPGWHAIDSVFEKIYPGQTPRHYGTALSAVLGGNDPLQGISAYESRRDRAHWHFVTYGFSDLFEKEVDGDESGFGFELTMRVARGDETDPPPWVINFLQNLARYVFKSGNAFEDGHYLDSNGPIAVGSGTALVGVLFIADDEAGRIETPNGSVAFLQVVGVTRDEYEAAQRWRSAGVCEILREQNPALVTDLSRGSALADAAAQARVEAGLAKDGSTCGQLYLDKVEVEGEDAALRMIIGARGVLNLRALLPYRLPFGRSLALYGREQIVALKAGSVCAARRADYGMDLDLTPDQGAAFLALIEPKAGTYTFAPCPNLTIHVVRSETLDQAGKVIDVIG